MNRPIRTAVVVAAAALSLGAVVGPATTATASASASPATASPAMSASAATPDALVYVDATATNGAVSKDVMGENMLWQQGGLGMFDESTDQFYPSVINQINDDVKPGSLRYPGGATADLFHWQRAIGPQAQRSTNAPQVGSGPSEMTVGPDEYGQLLKMTGADGLLTANFGTGTAAEAAGFIAYMTGAPGSSKWADMRVANGHRAPYDIRYVEVGNEQYLSSELYWRGGTPVSVGGPPGACQQVVTCLYIYGGTTSFTNQATVGYDDWSAAASTSTGTKGQSFYAQYPPVGAGSDTVFVAGTAWTRVSSLATAGPDDDVYTIDDATGRITFGDGTNGAVPDSGAAVTLSYVSGPHDGFLTYYREIKAADPNLDVCTTDGTDDFLAAMGATLPYDCVEDHKYTTVGGVADTVPMPQYRDEMIAAADDKANLVASQQQAVRYYAHRNVPLYDTEYGQLLNAVPNADPTYLESLNAALANASELANLIRLGIPVADRQLLNGPVADDGDLPGKATTAVTPGPDSYVTPSGEIAGLFAPLAGGTQLAVQQPLNPALPDSFYQKTGSLNTVAVRHGNEIDVLAVNRNNTDDLATQVTLDGAAATGSVDYTRLDGPDGTSINTADDPNTVGYTSGHVVAHGGSVPITLPAHSVTLLRIPVRATTSPAVSMTLHAPSAVAPGTSFSLQATVHNGGAAPTRSTVTPYLPAGWSATPAAASTLVNAHANTSVTFTVLVPAGTPELQYQPSAVLRDAGGSLDRDSSTALFVRTLPDVSDVVSDTFDGQARGAPPADYDVSGPAGGVTIQPAPDGRGQVLQLHRDAGAAQATATRALPASSGVTQLRFTVYAKQNLVPLSVQVLDGNGTPVVQMKTAVAAGSANPPQGAGISWSNGTAFVGSAHQDEILPDCDPSCFLVPGRTDTFELDLDPAAGTYKAYFNGELVAQPAINTAAGAPASLVLQMPSTALAGTFDVDNVAFATST